MEFDFENADLRFLYLEGRSSKGGVDQRIIKRFQRAVKDVGAAESIYDLQARGGLRFKKLEGAKDNCFSVRINEQYRLLFEIEFLDQNRTTGRICFLKLTNHYED